MSAAANILDGAAQLIDQKGWIQGEAVNEGGFCAVWAILCAATDAGATSAVSDQALTALRHVTGEPISRWNDRHGRKKDEVLRAMREAARRTRSGQ